MPFKLLKKSRQYNVLSKDLFVITVVCLGKDNLIFFFKSKNSPVVVARMTKKNLIYTLHVVGFFLPFINLHVDDNNMTPLCEQHPVLFLSYFVVKL